MELLDSLLNRGDLVELVCGKLTIRPASGEKVPADWLDANSESFALTLAARANKPLYKYLNYTVGSYGKHKADGVTLRFINMETGEEAYVVFNADRTRSVTTTKGKAGSKLSGKQFKITKNMAFYKFWLRSGLSAPENKYLSEFHRVMGRLKSVFFTMVVNDGKADKNTIQALTIEKIEQPINRGKTGEELGEEVGKNRGRNEGKENNSNPYPERVRADFNRVPDELRIKLTSNYVSKVPLQSVTTPYSSNTGNNEGGAAVAQDEGVDEWLKAYNSS